MEAVAELVRVDGLGQGHSSREVEVVTFWKGLLKEESVGLTDESGVWYERKREVMVFK